MLSEGILIYFYTHRFDSVTYITTVNKGTRPIIDIGSHRWRSIGYRFFPIPLKVGPDFIGTEWNGIGNGCQVFIGPINKGHQKYLAAQITRHKSKSVNVVFYNLIFLINVSCLNRNLTSQFRTFVCISYDRVWPENIKFVYQNGHKKKQQASFEWKTAQSTLQEYDVIILKNDNFKIAWACANRNPKHMIIGIFGGINSLGL